MLPWFTTSPPALANTNTPLSKSADSMSSAEATRPPTLTCAFAPNSTPLVLIRKMLLLDLRLPKRSDAEPPSTRLIAMLVAPVWVKLTVYPSLIENVSQLDRQSGVQGKRGEVL